MSAFAGSIVLEPFFTLALERLDALLELEMRRLRARFQLSLDEQRGLYISDERVDELLRANSLDQIDSRSTLLIQTAEGLRERGAFALSESPHWFHVSRTFALTAFQLDVLVLALAPELNLKYQTIYAYLNDAVTKKFPTRDLALRLFAGESMADARASLSLDGALFSDGLLIEGGTVADAGSWLAGAFIAAEAVAHFLVGVRANGGRPSAALAITWPSLAWNDTGIEATTQSELKHIAKLRRESIVMLEGHPGCGRDRAAEAVAKDLGAPLITIDLRLERVSTDMFPGLMRNALLLQRLHTAVIHIASGDELIDRDGPFAADLRGVFRLLAKRTRVVLVSVSPEARWREAFGGTRSVVVTFAPLSARERLRVWQELRGDVSEDEATALVDIANRFAFTRGQIERASDAANDHATLRPMLASRSSVNALFESVRAESRRGLSAIGALATRTTTTATWSDLVLPEHTKGELLELASAIRFRGRVYDEWEMASRNSNARGVRALFSGASGTGKTTSAAIIASSELSVDLYTIDLSAVTSKYIGETEKNLDRIFRAARDSSAILFFDEADALFGKRSEVKDAHDRYSNIEVAYLLQKIDQHDGTVLLATNLASNLDQGFSRRMHYTIEFPLPNAADRERIWRGMFPNAAPQADGIDFAFLARQFNIAGGDIRNVALSAAFTAAAANRAIEMKDLVRAMARQLTKQGRTASVVEFREYFEMVNLTENSVSLKRTASPHGVTEPRQAP
ncbi:MAG: ATP-binding protein [Gemmatimonas sp.]